MAFYEFTCDDCGENFEVRCGMSERDAERTCPKCGGKNTRRLISRVNTGKSCSAPAGSRFT